MKKIIIFVFGIFLNFGCLASDNCSSSSHSFPTKMVIRVPFTDLRQKPVKSVPNLPYPILYKDNPLQDSQLLMGEYIYAFNKKNIPNGGKWLHVYALEQSKFDGSNWTYKEGWIEKEHAIEVEEYPSYNLVVKKQWINIFSEPSQNSSAETYLSIGTKLLGKGVTSEWYKVFLANEKIGYVFEEDIYYLKAQSNETEQSLRKQILEIATSFLNAPYSWGGRSGYNKYLNYQQTSVDCSGFTNLVYKSLGLEIPRDAHDQFIKCNKLTSGKELKTGDLIFFAQEQNPNKIIHVGLFEIDEYFGPSIIESTGEWPYKNTIWPEIMKFGKKIDQIKNGEKCGSHIVYFGSFLNDPNFIAELRAKSLKNYFAEFKGMSTNFTTTTDFLDHKITLTQN